ncbi:MAG TPA: helix-turn-helix transcriptional regulator, partial [Bdellovibrio sp.]|nr:helix-turn-helix transcriptional regulator [Bdellovibrio sp.]
EKRVGIIFRGIRFKHDLTQAEVAKKLGLDQSDISKIENGRRSIGKALAKKIEKEFGIDYRRLL